MARARVITDHIAVQAAEWIVRLSAGDAGQREQARQGFERWQGEHPLHVQAAQGMQGMLGNLNTLVADNGGSEAVAAGLRSAVAPDSRLPAGARRAINALTLILCLAAPAWLAMQVYPPSYLLSDMHTGTGQWETRVLPDGSSISLSTASAANFRFDAARRTVELLGGEMLVQVAHDAGRPFMVETSEGSIRALGTRFIVRRVEGQGTLVSMLESKIAVWPSTRREGDGTIVAAGQQVRIHADYVEAVTTIDPRARQDAWQQHQLAAPNRPITDVLDELNRYRPGRILYDRHQLAGLNMTAVLPLDDTQRALQLLADAVPGLRVRQFSAYFTYIDKPDQP